MTDQQHPITPPPNGCRSWRSKVMADNMNWLPINTAPKEFKPFNMFVAIALEVPVGPNGVRYTSDPWCVWKDRDGSFARWPHSFAPTHWCPLPDYDPRRPKPKSLARAATATVTTTTTATATATAIAPARHIVVGGRRD